MSSDHDHDHDILYNTAVLKLLDLYSSFDFTPQHSQYTVLASFFLFCSGTTDIKVISLGTGTKCLPAYRLSPKGEIVNDSHAEVLARRSAVLWFLEEINRICSVDAYYSPWLEVCSDARYALRDGVKLNLYISTIPCKFCFKINKESYFCLLRCMKVETLPCAVWHLSKTKKWPLSKTTRSFLLWTPQLHLEVEIITRVWVSYEPNLAVQIRLRLYACHVATK